MIITAHKKARRINDMFERKSRPDFLQGGFFVSVFLIKTSRKSN